MSGTFAIEQAAVGILAAVAYADGRLADEELVWWKRVRGRHKLIADLPPSLFNPMLARAQATLAGQPWVEAITDWAEHIPREHAEMIYCMAVELQLVDGESTRRESQVTVHLAHALGLSVERSTQLFEVLLVDRLGD